MKKIIITIALCFFIGQIANAQKIKGVAILGCNLTQVDGDRVFGYHKVGANIGVGAILPFTDAFSLHVETIVTQKGSREAAKYLDSLDGSYKLNLDYAEIPVYVNFFDRKGKMNIGAGFAWGRLINFSEYQNGYKIDFPHAYITKPISDDVSCFANMYFSIYKGLKLNLRYQYSMKSIRHRIFSDGNYREQYNNVVTIRLMYVFNDKVKLSKDN